jgi:hypothetical protein
LKYKGSGLRIHIVSFLNDKLLIDRSMDDSLFGRFVAWISTVCGLVELLNGWYVDLLEKWLVGCWLVRCMEVRIVDNLLGSYVGRRLVGWLYHLRVKDKYVGCVGNGLSFYLSLFIPSIFPS